MQLGGYAVLVGIRSRRRMWWFPFASSGVVYLSMSTSSRRSGMSVGRADMAYIRSGEGAVTRGGCLEIGQTRGVARPSSPAELTEELA